MELSTAAEPDADPSRLPLLADDLDITPLLAVIPVGAGPIVVGGATADVMAAVETVQHEMLKLPQADIPVRHTFTPGLYARQISIPAGAFLMGKIQKHEHLNIVLSGSITVMVNGLVERITAPWQGVLPGGTKKVGFAHEDTVWMTVHANPTDERDVATLERHLISESYAEYLAYIETLQLPGTTP